MNTFPAASNEDTLLNSQNNLFHTLAIMQHHDAITGTHEKAVGVDYRIMMQHSMQWTLLGLSAQIQEIAASQGLQLNGFKQCKLQGMAAICKKLEVAEKPTKHAISFYNSNLET